MRRDILLNIDIAKPPVFNREFTVKKGDSLFLNVCMFQYGKILRLDNQRIRTYVRKSDGSLLMQGEDIDIISENEFQVKLKNSATNVSGLCYMEMEFQDLEEASVVIATNPILFEVEDRVGDVEDAIKAVDDLYLVGEIEKFIINAKVDIALLKEQIAEGLVKIGEFNEFVITKSEELQSKIDIALTDIEALGNHYTNYIKESSEEYLSNITGLSEDYGHKIEKLSDEFLLSISIKCDEIINSIRTESNNAFNEMIEIKNSSVSEMVEIRNNAVSEMTSIRENAISDISGLREEAVSELEGLRDTGLNEISNAKTTALSDITEAGASQATKIMVLGDEKVEEVKTKCDESKEELSSFTSELKEELSSTTDEKISSINTKADELKEELEVKTNEKVAQIEAKGAEKVEEINQLEIKATEKIEEMQNAISSVEEIIATLDTKSTEGQEISNALIALIETCNALKQQLEAENIEANSNIEQLNTLHPESDVRIETLRALIEEAKKYEEVVRRWIDNNGDGNIATEEVLLAIETLRGEIADVDAKLGGYATKEELEEAINGIEIPTIDHLATKKELEEGLGLYIDDIGEDPHPVCYKTEPEMLERETHYIRYKSYDKKYRVSYLSGYIEPAYETYVSNNKVHLWRMNGLGVSYRTFVYESGTWNLVSNESIIRLFGNSSDINTCLESVYSTNIRLMNKNKTEIIVDIKEYNPQQVPINNYNNATNTGNYYVYHQNAISNSYVDNIEGILSVSNTKGFIKQELSSLDGEINAFRTKGTNGWTAWSTITPEVDMENIYTKEEVDEIVSNISGGSSSDSIFDNNYISLLNNTIEIMKQRGL